MGQSVPHNKNTLLIERQKMPDVPDKQVKRLRTLIQEAETNLAAANELLISLVGDDEKIKPVNREEALGKVIEGVFDGQNMVGSDGKTYPVPANYASKSKLVQGDILKLTIADDGAFLYKQIGPIPRKQVVGTLILENGHYFVDVNEKRYRVLLASVTYFKAKPGDQVSVNVPEDESNAEWAALEAAL
ncbi:MAG TPA: hypothetical protein VL989_02615 [Candidatus Sulfotelmatobacter sp.]|nr:hypothetical protein [Candidatus Sulfotelmatobacter sp.]